MQFSELFNRCFMLYRGVNKGEDEKNAGRLLPKGSRLEVVAKLDGKWKLDGKFLLGACESNTARAHHIESGLYGGSGISTSRSESEAIKFATLELREDGVCYKAEGYIYVIDESLLEAAGVTAHKFSDPEYPYEEEVTLIEKSGGPLPESVIVEKYAVNRNGKRI